MSKTVRTRYVPVRTSIRLGKYVLLASSTYFYHAFCTQYVLSTYCFRKVRTWYVQGENSTYLVRTWGKKYVPVQSSTRWYSTIDEYNSVRTGTYRVRTTVHDSRCPETHIWRGRRLPSSLNSSRGRLPSCPLAIWK